MLSSQPPSISLFIFHFLLHSSNLVPLTLIKIVKQGWELWSSYNHSVFLFNKQLSELWLRLLNRSTLTAKSTRPEHGSAQALRELQMQHLEKGILFVNKEKVRYSTTTSAPAATASDAKAASCCSEWLSLHNWFLVVVFFLYLIPWVFFPQFCPSDSLHHPTAKKQARKQAGAWLPPRVNPPWLSVVITTITPNWASGLDFNRRWQAPVPLWNSMMPNCTEDTMPWKEHSAVQRVQQGQLARSLPCSLQNTTYRVSVKATVAHCDDTENEGTLAWLHSDFQHWNHQQYSVCPDWGLFGATTMLVKWSADDAGPKPLCFVPMQFTWLRWFRGDG